MSLPPDNSSTYPPILSFSSLFSLSLSLPLSLSLSTASASLYSSTQFPFRGSALVVYITTIIPRFNFKSYLAQVVISFFLSCSLILSSDCFSILHCTCMTTALNPFIHLGSYLHSTASLLVHSSPCFFLFYLRVGGLVSDWVLGLGWIAYRCDVCVFSLLDTLFLNHSICRTRVWSTCDGMDVT